MSQNTSSRSVPRQSMWSFFREFLRDRQRIGAIAPTSTAVGRHMARLAGVAEARTVVELGAGTGAITAPVIEALPADARMWAYEIHDPFLAHLRERFDDPRVTFLNESAEAVRELRAREAPEGFDAIVCSIPFSLLPPVATDGILAAAAAALRPGGTFVALQYHPTYLVPLLRRHFGSVRREFHPFNLPPTLLINAREPRGDR